MASSLRGVDGCGSGGCGRSAGGAVGYLGPDEDPHADLHPLEEIGHIARHHAHAAVARTRADARELARRDAVEEDARTADADLGTPIGFDGPAGIERGMLFAQSLPG